MDEEYCKQLEEYVGHLSMALIVDMMKKGIFVDDPEEIKLEEGFINEIKEIYEKLEGEDSEEKILLSVLEALKNYYGKDMYEEEILPRANIILGFLTEELMDEK